MDAEQLHRAQATYLNPAVPKSATTGQASTANPAPAPAPPLENLHEPVPISQMPVINPVRPPIANPYDILNR